MGKFNKSLIGAVIIGVVGTLASLPALALPFLSGTMGVSGGTDADALQPPGNFLTTATSVKLADTDGDGDGDLLAGARTGDFAALVAFGDEINVQDQIMSLVSLGTKIFDFSEVGTVANRGISFHATTFAETIGLTGPGSYSVTSSGAGYWTDSNGVWGNSGGLYTLSLTQTDIGGGTQSAVSFSGTLAATGRQAPEPGILALMGLGLGGLAFLRRRRDSKV